METNKPMMFAGVLAAVCLGIVPQAWAFRTDGGQGATDSQGNRNPYIDNPDMVDRIGESAWLNIFR